MLDVINVYRSQSGHSVELLENIKKLIEIERVTVITGSFVKSLQTPDPTKF